MGPILIGDTMSTHMTFAQFAERWLADYAPVAYKPSTEAEYAACIRNHLSPCFGSLDLNEITPARVQSYVAKANASELSAASVRNHLTVLRSLFAVANSWGLVDTNPIDGVVGPRASRAEISYLSPAEMRLLIESTPSKWRPLIASACLLGLRKGELLALRWQDVDPERAVIEVRHTLYQSQLQAPKTRSSIRTVPIPHTLAVLLEDARPTLPCQSDFLFDIKPREVNRLLSRALRRAGLEDIRFHDLRHSFVAAHIQAGTQPKVIQSLLGHASIKTTLDTYGHLMPGLHASAASALEGQIFGEEAIDGNHQA